MGTRSKAMVVGSGLIVALNAGCQPGEAEIEVDPGAIPAADDVRPGTEATPDGAALGTAADTASAEPAGMPLESGGAVPDTL